MSRLLIFQCSKDCRGESGNSSRLASLLLLLLLQRLPLEMDRTGDTACMLDLRMAVLADGCLCGCGGMIIDSGLDRLPVRCGGVGGGGDALLLDTSTSILFDSCSWWFSSDANSWLITPTKSCKFLYIRINMDGKYGDNIGCGLALILWRRLSVVLVE